LKIAYNSLGLHPISTKTGLYIHLNMLLLPSKFKAYTSYCGFSKACEKKKIKKNTMNIRLTLKVCTYLHDGWMDLTEIWNEMCPTLRGFPQQKWCSFVLVLSSYRCVKTAFSWFLYSTHLSVTRPHWLYLAAWHTMECLDSREISVRLKVIQYRVQLG